MSIDQEQVVNELFTIRDFVRWSLSQFHRHEVFFGHGTDNAWDEAVQLVLGAVDLPWSTDPAVLDGRLTYGERKRVVDFLRQRVEERRPLPYIVGEAWYLDMPFYVNESVLIPRSPIAELIRGRFEPWLRPGPVGRILDLCTGSGCIGIGCAYAFEEAEVDLVDISVEALEVAARNVARHGLEDRVHPIQSDMLSALQGRCYDLIVCNPPYVDAADLASMPAEYRHEPELALGSGDDGLDLTRALLRQACDFLADDGLLVVEVGNSEVHLMQQYPQIPFIWVDLEHGNGVFTITADELRRHRDEI
ncbi:50S ribosomal protein L3 glutamine methyltransferase [Marinobacterium nitratireducens]|uniref:Ribosomal protein uL3 glutamine methyltransferase n=1 Tax=Marinobacterium nitratireducens TaxID=518897 RepID=A0A918DPP0_9GAMM|nr:50S ribosomal protein L3 N(5)-glutamine methyltransferase [Marinobacterium nitratireducens]GGO75905.1 50S ribosomal protein L3 glutamine methyltransferase [Marinobacterium nitratireducens]